MSDIPVNPLEPNGSLPPTGGEGVAERFVDHELIESRTSLARTRIVSIAMCVFVIAYMSYLTAGFRASLEPNGAAEIATGLASQRVDDLEPQFADYIHEQVPMMIRKAPDELIARLPEYRKELEGRVDKTVRTQAQQGATQLDKQLDDFLTAHKDEVGQLLLNGQDPAKTEQFGNELDKNLTDFMTTQKIGDTTIQQKLDETLITLRQVAARTTKLAGNKDLTPSERQARHAVAMLMRRIEAAQAANPLPTLDVNAIKDKVNGAADQIRANVQSNLPVTPATGGKTPAATSSTTASAKATAPAKPSASASASASAKASTTPAKSVAAKGAVN